MRSTPADAVDAVPSDVSPAPSDVGATSNGGGGGYKDFSLASELVSTIESSVGDGYIPYSEADKRYRVYIYIFRPYVCSHDKTFFVRFVTPTNRANGLESYLYCVRLAVGFLR